eukprot:TRINITY_DN3553_c0_g2_i4.p3 TRINITY_DN3553_c0_g2~~TRINITY_DN3553_c0_g2_i4.p3  ORF type:complete len:156 (-),score=11.37 TRINITY_DN3553_c0_g2_i4:181-648(-)
MLKPGDLLEIGYSLIEVLEITSTTCKVFFVEGLGQFEHKTFAIKHNYKIGRLQSNEIGMPIDTGLEPTHAVFESSAEGFAIRSVTKNAEIWERLAKEAEEGKAIEVKPGETIRLGLVNFIDVFLEGTQPPATHPIPQSQLQMFLVSIRPSEASAS